MTVDRSYGFGTQNIHSIFNTIKYMKLFRQSVFAIFFAFFFLFARPKLNEMNWKETTTTRYLCVQIGIVYIVCWFWAQFSLFHEFFFFLFIVLFSSGNLLCLHHIQFNDSHDISIFLSISVVIICWSFFLPTYLIENNQWIFFYIFFHIFSIIFFS